MVGQIQMDGTEDLRTLNMILQVIYNLSLSSSEIVDRILEQISLMDCIETVIN